MNRPRPDFSQFGTPRKGQGAAARSRRGAFAQSWWGRALVTSMEQVADAGRIARGRGHARTGQVISYRIAPGAVVGEVQGSQIDPFTATFTLRPLDPDAVDALIARVRSTPGMLAALASGTVPIELGDLLLPTESGELDFGCTCPDQGWPCKHAAAIVYLTAERLDTDPLVILTLRGLDLDTLIRSFDSDGADSESAPDLDNFFGDRTDLPPLPKVEFRPAPDDLTPEPLRRALRAGGVEEPVVAAALRELTAYYRILGGR
ncbi:SWIM zinc finger family protein [Rhodococcus sp. NPDC058514]|uniref:SWIM zinc finger family protein n=1 Tax=unclassified Rhodococcus (in: high G+C Gram-positive bacteria) TaxID=192944 RepID=UPI00365149CC